MTGLDVLALGLRYACMCESKKQGLWRIIFWVGIIWVTAFGVAVAQEDGQCLAYWGEPEEDLLGIGLPEHLALRHDKLPSRWELVRLMELGGVEAVREYINGRVLIGVATLEGMHYARLMEVAKLWMRQRPEFLIRYVTPEIVKALGPQGIAGIILPGGAANYPKLAVGERFVWGDAYEPFPNEAAYQALLPWAHAHAVPVLAICLGAQQAALYLGAQLERVGTGATCVDCDRPVRVLEGSALAQLMGEQDLLAGAGELSVRRLHRFAVLADTLPAEVTLEAFSELGTLMAFSYEDWLVALQFHPELCYRQWATGEACDAHSNAKLLERYFERCGLRAQTVKELLK